MKETMALKNTKVRYWQYHETQKPVIIMVHGFRGTHHGLLKIVEALPDFHVIVPDLPGFGESTPFTNTPHSLKAYVTFLGDFIRSLQLQEPPILLGHSFGSIVASHFAAKNPSAIGKLILVNPIGAPALKGPRGIMTRFAIMYYWLGRKLPARASKAWLSNKEIVKIMSVTMAKTNDTAIRRFIHSQHLSYFSNFANPTVVAEAFGASVNHDVSEVAKDIWAKTLLIAGEKDDITPLEKQKELAKKMPNATLTTINNVGHLIHYETPGAAATAIRAFLQ